MADDQRTSTDLRTEIAQKLHDWLCDGAGMQHESDRPYVCNYISLECVVIEGEVNLEAMAEFVLGLSSCWG